MSILLWPFIKQVEFQIFVSERTGYKMAVNIAVVKRNSDIKHQVRDDVTSFFEYGVTQ